MKNFFELFDKKICVIQKESYLCNPKREKSSKVLSMFNAEVAQLVEHNLAKVGVARSNRVFCSKFSSGNFLDDHFYDLPKPWW